MIIRYEFSDGDLRICMRQLKIFLDDYEEAPFKVLKYTAGQIHYGGRVTVLFYDTFIIIMMVITFIIIVIALFYFIQGRLGSSIDYEYFGRFL